MSTTSAKSPRLTYTQFHLLVNTMKGLPDLSELTKGEVREWARLVIGHRPSHRVMVEAMDLAGIRPRDGREHPLEHRR